MDDMDFNNDILCIVTQFWNVKYFYNFMKCNMYILYIFYKIIKMLYFFIYLCVCAIYMYIFIEGEKESITAVNLIKNNLWGELNRIIWK